VAEDRRKDAVAQADLIRGWRPKTHAQEGYRPQAQGASGSEKPKPPAGGSGVSPTNQDSGPK